MSDISVENKIECALLSTHQPLTIAKLQSLFKDHPPSLDEIRSVLQTLSQRYQERSVELKEVASGFRLQIRAEYIDVVHALWEEKPARYSKACLETLALIAYRQPVTRSEIEAIRGVSVNTLILRTLLERDWIKVVGHRQVPGYPALYATTKTFLDDFNLKTLEELPELKDFAKKISSDTLPIQLALSQSSPSVIENSSE